MVMGAEFRPFSGVLAVIFVSANRDQNKGTNVSECIGHVNPWDGFE